MIDPATLVAQPLVAPGVYEVSRAKIREFAAAVGETSALCQDVDAARAAGYADLVAPPTFAVVPSFRGLYEVMSRVGAPLHQQVHGEQGFTHHRPIVAGDELVTTAVLEKARAVGGSHFLTIASVVSDPTGEPVCTARSVVVVLAGAA